VTIDPHTLGEVLDSVTALGKVCGRETAADALVESLRARLEDVVRRVAARPRPRVLVLEWTEPAFAPGHWVPEMVTLAGGTCVLGRPGEKSYRIAWDQVVEARPDVVVCAPCGFDLEGASELAREVASRVDVPVWAVDANASFARPGPRLVDGVEALAGILHPDVTPPLPGLARQIS
jgi:iron complex transport system substrate-binding protein